MSTLPIGDDAEYNTEADQLQSRWSTVEFKTLTRASECLDLRRFRCQTQKI